MSYTLLIHENVIYLNSFICKNAHLCMARPSSAAAISCSRRGWKAADGPHPAVEWRGSHEWDCSLPLERSESYNYPGRDTEERDYLRWVLVSEWTPRLSPWDANSTFPSLEKRKKCKIRLWVLERIMLLQVLSIHPKQQTMTGQNKQEKW